MNKIKSFFNFREFIKDLIIICPDWIYFDTKTLGLIAVKAESDFDSYCIHVSIPYSENKYKVILSICLIKDKLSINREREHISENQVMSLLNEFKKRIIDVNCEIIKVARDDIIRKKELRKLTEKEDLILIEKIKCW